MRVLGFNISREKRASLEDPSVSLSDPAAMAKLADMYGWAPSASGVPVSHDTALNMSAAWACVSLISGIFSSLPVEVRRRTGDRESEAAREHPAHMLLSRRPNDWMSSVVWRETGQAHALTWGNHYSRRAVNRRGETTRILPLDPSKVRPERQGGQLRYRVELDSGATEFLAPEEMIHVPGLGFDGLTGYSVINRARQSIGLGLATEEFGARFFANDARPGLVLTHPRKLDGEAIENIKNAWMAAQQGLANAHKPAVLGEGMTATQVGFPPEDAQYLETRRFQVAEVCRWFGVPPFMIGDTERSTTWGTGLEQQVLGFVNFTFGKWLDRWEQELSWKLFGDDSELFVHFDLHALQRGDFKTRTDGYSSGINAGWLTRNEARAAEGMNPIEGLDEPLSPVNLAKDDDPEPEPDDAPPADDNNGDDNDETE